MIKYVHLDPAREREHAVALGVASPNTDARFCDRCHTEVRRAKPGEWGARPATIHRAKDTLCSKPKGHDGPHGTGKSMNICGVPMGEW